MPTARGIPRLQPWEEVNDHYKSYLLEDTKTCYRYLQAGFTVIVLTGVAGIVTLLAPDAGGLDLRDAYDVLVMPALFVGLGLLLFGVGTHLHIMHLNVLEMRENDDH